MKLTTDFSDERAVSPVVGVILMVAITVILAAVIGTFVLDLGSNQTAPPRAGVSYEVASSGTVTLTLTDPGNVEKLQYSKNGGSLSSWTSNPSAGDTVQVSVADGDVIRVVGTNNGQSGVVSSYTYSA